jgi:(1->4)-alpha-D-glucan 1-alpha-D-glucosylmutase
MYVPTATYRFQFGPSFGFKDAEALVPYLHALGISDIYASPIFKANAGSTHGYDVTDPNKLNPQLGSAEEFAELTAKRRQYDIGWLQDIVPNHMAYSSGNSMLMDVFEHGLNSRYADFFDVVWDHPDESLKGKILAPFLGKPCTEALRKGEIRLERSESGMVVHYQDVRFPLALSSYSRDKPPTDAAALQRLLDKQFFKLSFWKQANKSINYRRFFYLNAFIGLNAERPEVFSETHKLISDFLREGVFTGLRVDHIDGLYDPAEYLTRLRRLAADQYVVVEKILDLDESLSGHWPVQGTTGYDFCNYVNGIFVRADSERAFTEIYRQLTNRPGHYHELLIQKKRTICEKYMAGEIDYLAHLLGVAARDLPDIAGELPENVRQAIVEIICAFSVYRTYINDENYSAQDKAYMAHAVIAAKKDNPAIRDAIDFVGRFLLLDFPNADISAARRKILAFLMKFQQLTGPVMAKGFEDTLLYSYNRLISLNEVGSSPDRFGILLEEFHRFNAAKAARQPHGLNATSTHDTKRGQDVRTRISVLTEMPELWSTRVRHWRQMNAGYKTDCHGTPAPDANDEYLLYQTLIGVMPFEPVEWCGFRERIKQYMTKVVRESKEHSSWIEPGEQYERACGEFVERILNDSGSNEFLRDFLPFQKRVAVYGMFNSLSQTLLKMTSPGVPDFYQGGELWDLSLVDPDNRRPVDFDKRRRFLEEVRSKEGDDNVKIVAEMLRRPQDGRIKLFLIFKVLGTRRERAELFGDGDYQPLTARGKYSEHIVGFVRSWRDQSAATVTPRFLTSLINTDELPVGTDVWKDTEIPWPDLLKGQWRNTITGEIIQIAKAPLVGELLAQFPAALLIRV